MCPSMIYRFTFSADQCSHDLLVYMQLDSIFIFLLGSLSCELRWRQDRLSDGLIVTLVQTNDRRI